MELSLTKEQLRNLLVLTYIGNWVANADRSDDELDIPLNDAEQLLFAAAHNAGLANLVEGPDSDGMYSATALLEEMAETYLDEYERGYLLEDVAIQLARRDLIQKIGEPAFEKMGPERLAAELNPFLDSYMEEFEENGVTNLRVVTLKK
ncbi:MAG: hypothetical protein GW949_04670 [Spirochaetales bacterium]|nr:hypothetical protein [Spirochaetales bacterium]